VHRGINRTSSPPGDSLAARFDPRHNSLSVMRVSLAVVVAVVHASSIGWQRQPMLGHTELGQLAVDGFFVVSGFLVTASALRLPLARYAWHRALRILPGFWTCLVVVAFGFAPFIAWQQGRGPDAILTGEQSAFHFLTANALVLMRQWDIGGLMSARDGGALDGSLWTLWYEALCYAGLAALVGAARLLRVQRWCAPVLATAVVLAWAVTVAQALGLVGGPAFLPRFVVLFGLGGLGRLLAHRVRFTPRLLLASFGVLAASLWLDDYRTVGAVAFAHLMLWTVVALPLRAEPAVDVSYGMYVYHWPVEQALFAAGAAAWGVTAFSMVALALAAGFALASWRFVEAPALSRKNARWVDRPWEALVRPGATRPRHRMTTAG